MVGFHKCMLATVTGNFYLLIWMYKIINLKHIIPRYKFPKICNKKIVLEIVGIMRAKFPKFFKTSPNKLGKFAMQFHFLI